MQSGGETQEHSSGWTVDTLAQHMQRQVWDLRQLLQERHEAQTVAMQTALVAADRASQERLAAAEKAVNKAEVAVDKRLESMNEFRAQLADQASTFLPRTEANVRIDALAEKVDALASRLDLTAGRSHGIDKSWGYLIAFAGVAASIIAIVLSTR